MVLSTQLLINNPMLTTVTASSMFGNIKTEIENTGISLWLSGYIIKDLPKLAVLKRSTHSIIVNFVVN